MSIDTSGKWWIGSEPADLHEYLKAYTQETYELHQFRLSKCSCGCVQFRLHADDDEGVAKRVCSKCGLEHFICDSGEFWEDADPKQWRCIKKCKSELCNVGVGFSQYADSPTSIKWIYVGVRCAKCGLLGCFAGWKVGQDDVAHLFDEA